MASKRKSRKTEIEQKRTTGADSVIISRSQVLKRSSVISAALSSRRDNTSTSGVSDLREEEARFKQTIEREITEGKYTIEKRLTAGGMGAVYYVYDKDFNRHSAMKVILPELKHDLRAIDSFIKEAKITGQLEHPNIIPVHDLGFFPEHGIFFTMKLMSGEPLNVILQKLELGDPQYLERYDMFVLLGIFRKVCDAVAFAHSKQILHRDIKPHNIMVGEYGEVLLMDWGLAKRLDEELGRGGDPCSGDHRDYDWLTTEIGVVKGSPAYMSPEQALGDVAELDERSDIFLLGATLYSIFSFYPPYIGDDINEIVGLARGHRLVPPDELDTGRWRIPEDLLRIIMKALAESKVDRYQDVDELIADIDDFLRGDVNFCHRYFSAGDVLIREGEIGCESYIIVRGKVRVDKKRDGQSVTICTLEAGDIVGEMSLITSETRSATVTATEETEVLVLTQDLFTQHLTKLPPWLGKTIVLLAERLNAANDIIPDVGGDRALKKRTKKG